MLFILFEAQGRTYGLESSIIEEVIPSVPLDPVPEAPSHIAGKLIYRKRILQVLDFSQLTERRPSRKLLSTRILILKGVHNRHSIGLRAEGAVGFEDIPSDYVKVYEDIDDPFSFGSAKLKSGGGVYCVNYDRLLTESVSVDEKFFSLNYSS